MSDLFIDQINLSLHLLYNHSSTFNVSIDLIQRLAQLLKLDTFIDKDAYTHVTTTKSTENFKRLSIAGSLILIDIDFLDDTTILNVSLSLANQLNYAQNGSVIIRQEQESEGKSTSVTISLINSFLSQNAEGILLQNLVDPLRKLNYFPSNLKYLSCLDQLSSTQLDLFVQLDKIGSIFVAINELEKEKSMFSDSIGKVLFNNMANGQLGLFLNFWRDYRKINNGRQEENLIGKDYNLLITIPRKDVEMELKSTDEVWSLKTGMYTFKFEDTSMKSLPLCFELEHSIAIPKKILQYLDILPESLHAIVDTPFQELNQFGDILFKTTKAAGIIIIKREDSTQEFVQLNSFSLKELVQIVDIIPTLRNFITFNNLIKSLTDELSSEFESYSLEKEQEVLTKKTLKDTLNLENEELLGLTLSAENPVLSSIKSVKPEGVDLDTFVETEVEIVGENDIDDLNTDVNQAVIISRKSYIQLLIEYVDFTSNTLDIILNVNGFFEGKEIDIKFKVVNGDIQSTSEDIEMIDGDDGVNSIEKRFIGALNVTEDIIQSINHVFK